MVSEYPYAALLCEFTNGLNPCFSGGWSRRREKVIGEPYYTVLILVLVEDGLGGTGRVTLNGCTLVLILVLVEDGLGADTAEAAKEIVKRS